MKLQPISVHLRWGWIPIKQPIIKQQLETARASVAEEGTSAMCLLDQVSSGLGTNMYQVILTWPSEGRKLWTWHVIMDDWVKVQLSIGKSKQTAYIYNLHCCYYYYCYHYFIRYIIYCIHGGSFKCHAWLISEYVYIYISPCTFTPLTQGNHFVRDPGVNLTNIHG